jgi:NADP-dependent 3-hydroxy acid dehydrogenase YdfG
MVTRVLRGSIQAAFSARCMKKTPLKLNDPMKLNDHVAIVTGAGSGIGAAISAALAQYGCQVIAVGRRRSALEETKKRFPDTIDAVAADVADRNSVDKVVAFASEKYGRIDVLVNSAGTNTVDRATASVSPEEWHRIFQVNATGAFNCIQTVLPMMRQQSRGTIINISSVAGRRAIPLGGVAYNASKFAMTALGTTVGEEERANGIRVTNIFPGEVETPILDTRPVAVSAEHRAKILQPEDVAESVLLVCTLPSRARVPELVIVPTIQSFI